MVGLDPGSGDAVCAQDRDRGLPLRAQVQVVLVKLAEQLPALDLQAVLQLAVAGRGGLRAVEEGEYLLEPFAARGETADLDLSLGCFWGGGRAGRLTLPGGAGWRRCRWR